MPSEHLPDIKADLQDVDLLKVEAFSKAKRTSVLVIFFDDMQGSTALKQRITEEVDEEAFQNVRREHDAIVTEIITRDTAGEIVKSTGDGVLAILSEPSTAVERCVEIQTRLKGHSRIKVRIGLDMGQVRVEKAGGVQSDLYGRHVDWAARVTSMAEAGHTLVTRSVFIDAFGWIPKSTVAWKDHGFYHKKESEEALELFEPYDSGVFRPMDEPRGIQKSQKKQSSPDFMTFMVTGTACLCLLILTLGAVVAVANGAISVGALGTTAGISMGGGFLGLASMFYKLLAISASTRKTQ